MIHLVGGVGRGKQFNMNKAKLNLVLHLVGQVLAQTAVIELVPISFKPILAAIVAVVGVFIAFSDQSLSNQ